MGYVGRMEKKMKPTISSRSIYMCSDLPGPPFGLLFVVKVRGPLNPTAQTQKSEGF